MLLLHPTIRLEGHELIGHVGIVTSVAWCTEWDFARPPYHLLDVAECRGGEGRRSGVIATDGSLWEHHDVVWPKPEHRTWLVRVLS